MAALPNSPFAWGCLFAGLAFFVPAVRRAAQASILHSSRSAYVMWLAAGTLLLNLAYVHFYLRGGPRIIDATSYWLQARVFAEGSFTFAAPGPLHSFAGRFLVVTPSGQLSVLFPPGFAALLAVGMRLGLPLMVNPLLGALCSVLTYALGRSWWDEKVGRIAGVFSASCATLRYHSADTMSHAWCACLVLCLLLAMTSPPSRRVSAWGLPLLGGLCAGWLFATRPVTGLVFGSGGLFAFFWTQPRTAKAAARAAFTYLLGSLPGLCLWFTYQWTTTGSIVGSTQSVYYARSDWPHDCFTLGFGAHIGCRFEHGDFLADYQPAGFGLREALAVCGRRLWVHASDVANLPWLLLVSLLTLRDVTRSRPVAITWALLAAHVAVYGLFYYDGNYPGGGARLYAELLPLQHVLLASALTSMGREWSVVPLTAIGFAFWGAKQHADLAEREGGRPMFEPEVLHGAGVERGLVFVNTDHGFNLGFDPNWNPTRSPLIVRARGDALDYATWMNAGQPEAYRYNFEPYQPRSGATLTPYTPPPNLAFVGANLWPPAVAEFGAATPSLGGACGGPGLSLHPEGGRPQQTQVQLWVTTPGDYQLLVRSDAPIDVADWSLSTPDTPALTRDCQYRVGSPRRLPAGPLALTLTNSAPATVVSVELQTPSNP